MFIFSVQPICLPAPNQEFAGQPALAAGWGRHQPKHQATTATGQSRMLKYVDLRVSSNKLQHHKMFGTKIPEGGRMKDVCSGDSGRKHRALGFFLSTIFRWSSDVF